MFLDLGYLKNILKPFNSVQTASFAATQTKKTDALGSVQSPFWFSIYSGTHDVSVVALIYKDVRAEGLLEGKGQWKSKTTALHHGSLVHINPNVSVFGPSSCFFFQC